jgi:hypothetical protein
MDKKVVKFVTIGFGLYAVFAAAVLFFYEDNPDQMAWEDRQAYNKRYISQLSLEQNVVRVDVIERLGSPDLTEAKQVQDNRYQVMFYRTQHQQSDGITTKDECTPLLFKDDKLVAWGDSAYQEYLSY